MDILIYIGTSIFIAIITALFTARLAFNSFYKQEIWLRKEKEYSQLIEGLCTMKNYYNTEIENEIFNRSRGEDSNFDKELYRIAKNKFNLIRAGAGLLLDSNVNLILDKINIELNDPHSKNDTYFEYLDSVLRILNDSIAKIREIAIKDLNIKNK